MHLQDAIKYSRENSCRITSPSEFTAGEYFYYDHATQTLKTNFYSPIVLEVKNVSIARWKLKSDWEPVLDIGMSTAKAWATELLNDKPQDKLEQTNANHKTNWAGI